MDVGTSPANRRCGSRNRVPTVRLAENSLRIPVERAVSSHIGRRWAVEDVKDMTDFACHPAAILSDGSYPVFAKLSEATNSLEQFETELAGFRLLSDRSGVLTPTPIDVVPVQLGSILILKAVQPIDRAPRHWRQIGRTLAQIHRVQWDRFGLETHGYSGPLYQDNTPMNEWATFYRERRLRPGLRSAIDSGNIPPAVVRQVERLISHLPEFSHGASAPPRVQVTPRHSIA
ncbi:MAG: fructosamine kinase family protein [Anaerolineae bacterium]|jgi:fructosamine-3-kinase